MTIKLPKLQQGFPIANEDGTPSPAFHIWWDRISTQIQDSINDINTTLAAAKEYMGDIPDVIVAADYTGTVTSGQLPLTVACKRYNDTTNVTSSSTTWSLATISGGITASINSGTGAVSITALTATSVLEVTSVRVVSGTSVTLTKRFNVILDKAAAPTTAPSGGGGSGSGGTTSSVSSFTMFTLNTRVTVSSVLTVTVGSGGRVDLSAPLDYTTDSSTTVGNYPIKGIWQWDSTGGGVWVDIGTEFTSSPNVNVFIDSDVGKDWDDGSINITGSKTGLTASSTQKFRLQARNQTSNVSNMYLRGTASAVGS